MAEPAEPAYPVGHYCSRFAGARGARSVNPATITRWITLGVRTPSGRLRLPALRVGSRWMVCESAFAEFLAALTAATLPPDESAVPMPRSPAARRRASDAAARELKDRYGI